MNSDFFYFCLLLLVSSLSFGFVMVCLDGNSANRVGSESPLYQELVRREFVKRTFRIVLVACAMLACMAMLFRNAPAGWFDAGPRQPTGSHAHQESAPEAEKSSPRETSESEVSADSRSAGAQSAKTAPEKQRPAKESDAAKRTPSTLALDFSESLLAILAITLAFKNFRLGEEDSDRPDKKLTFGVGSFLTIVSSFLFAVLAFRIGMGFFTGVEDVAVILTVVVILAAGVDVIHSSGAIHGKNGSNIGRDVFQGTPLVCLGLWAGGGVCRWERVGLGIGNIHTDQMLRLLCVSLLIGASCLFMASKSQESGAKQ